MLIDTHCHLDTKAFDTDRQTAIERAGQAGVGCIIIPAIERPNFDRVRRVAHSFSGGCYALGIHPMAVPQAHITDLDVLNDLIQHSLADERFVAIGEIGLDFFVPELREPDMHAKQEYFYEAQLAMAAHYQLPVLLHVRRSQDLILKHLRRTRHTSGFAHAFNGSFQQAEQFIDQGFGLGIGGAMTFARARQIRRLATQLPIDALVLETDAPDIPPAWLSSGVRNEPGELGRIAECLAELRLVKTSEIARCTTDNALRILPRLNKFLSAGSGIS